ncbi:MAG: OmpA family protein [Bacteroidales bacterium]|nr:OmpA family protein [Bacteroidales bacterium]
MRKILLLLTFLALGLTSFAQTEFTTAQGTESHPRYITNKFWDNWFISAGVGAQAYLGESDDQLMFTKRLTPAFDFSVGKWIVPAVGFRVQANGFAFKGYTYNGNNAYVTGTEENLFKQEWDYLNVHGDILLNLSNALGGYKTDRFYSIVPYIGFGMITTLNEDPNDKEFSLNGGIINQFRLSDAVNLNLELRGAFFRESFDDEILIEDSEGMVAATVGLTYNFGNKEFKRYSAPAPAEPRLISAEDLAKLRQQVAAEQARTKQLQDELNAEKNKPKPAAVEKDLTAAALAIFFNIDRANLTAKEKINLKYIADVINQNPNEKFVITGHADKATGSAAHNQKLSEKRAQAVADYLIQELAVDSRQLEIKAVGDTQNSYDTPNLNRVVILRQ